MWSTGGGIWLGGTGSPAEQPSGFLVTLSLHMPASRTQTNRKRKPQCFLWRALSCGESDEFVSTVPPLWMRAGGFSLMSWAPSCQSEVISHHHRLPCAEVTHSPQHQPTGYCWTFQPKLPQTPAKELLASESVWVSVGPAPGKQSRSSLAKNAQIRFCSAFNWCWTVVVWTVESGAEWMGWERSLSGLPGVVVLSSWYFFPPYFAASFVIVICVVTV